MSIDEAVAILEEQGANGLRMSFEDALPTEIDKFLRCDGWVVQDKWDGWFTATAVVNEVGTMYSRTKKYRENLDCTGLADNVYFGELIENTQWSFKFQEGTYHGKLVIFDALLKHLDYIEFIEELRTKRLSDWLQVIANWYEEPAHAFNDAIAYGFEGIVLINGDRRVRVKKIIEDDFKILDIEMSTSDTAKRLGGMAKAIIYGDMAGKELGRCGSMPHDMKVDMFKHLERYIGLTVKISGKERFKSGAMRHPAFVCLRYKEDK